MQKKIAILGGGLSGLSSSLLMLQKFPNISLHLYEKTNSIGGAISSHQLENSDGSWLETGPSSIRKSFQINEIMKIIEETNLLSKSSHIFLNK